MTYAIAYTDTRPDYESVLWRVLRSARSILPLNLPIKAVLRLVIFGDFLSLLIRSGGQPFTAVRIFSASLVALKRLYGTTVGHAYIWGNRSLSGEYLFWRFKRKTHHFQTKMCSKSLHHKVGSRIMTVIDQYRSMYSWFDHFVASTDQANICKRDLIHLTSRARAKCKMNQIRWSKKIWYHGGRVYIITARIFPFTFQNWGQHRAKISRRFAANFVYQGRPEIFAEKF